MKHLTIIICTHNRSVLLEKTLASINHAHRPPGWHVDIMVVNNACTDNTVAVLDDYNAQAKMRSWLPLTNIFEPAPGKSHALNRAIKELRSDLLAFEDDDQQVDENYLAGICEAADSYPDATMFCGRLLPDWDGTESAWFHDTGPYRVYPFPFPRYDQGDTPHPIGQDGPVPGGGNLFIRRQVVDRIGGFATDLGPRKHNLGGGEDIDFIRRALKAGEQLVYIPNIIQYHYIDPERLRIGYLIKKSFLRSRDQIQTRQNTYTRTPLYMWRKLATYMIHVLWPFEWSKKGFYLMRVAATLGEIRGIQISRHKSYAEYK